MHRTAVAGTGVVVLILSSSPVVYEAVPQSSIPVDGKGWLFRPFAAWTAQRSHRAPRASSHEQGVALDPSRTWESVLFLGKNSKNRHKDAGGGSGSHFKSKRQTRTSALLAELSGGASGNSGRRPSAAGSRSGKRRPAPAQEDSFDDYDDEDEEEDDDESYEVRYRGNSGPPRGRGSRYDDDDDQDDGYEEYDDDGSEDEEYDGGYDEDRDLEEYEVDDSSEDDGYGQSEDTYTNRGSRDRKGSRYGGGGGRGRGSGRGGRGGGRRAAPRASSRFQSLSHQLRDAGAGLTTKLYGFTHKSAKLLRQVKGHLSSDLERTLIKATRPNNDPAKRKHVNLLLQAAENAFPIYMDPTDDSMAYWKEGPYWMTLHKLWRRMAEKDYRTVAKAVYVLHRLARGTTTESWSYFRMTIAQMRREEDKGTKSRYFSRRVIRFVDQGGQPYSDWLDKYADFVLVRVQAFAPDLSELAAVAAETSHEEASRALEKAEELIEAALECELGSDLDNDVTCDCLKLVIDDLCELWSLFQQKLEIRLQQRFAEGGFSNTELRQTLGFLEFYLEHLTPARELVEESHRMLALYNHAVPKGLGDALATDMLQEQVAWIQEELTEQAKASVVKPLDKDESAGSKKEISSRMTIKTGASSATRPQRPSPASTHETSTNKPSRSKPSAPISASPSGPKKKSSAGTTSADQSSSTTSSTKRRKLNNKAPSAGRVTPVSATATGSVGMTGATGAADGRKAGGGGVASSPSAAAARSKKCSSSSGSTKKKSSKSGSTAARREGK